MVLVLVRQENTQRFFRAAFLDRATQVAIGWPLMPAAEKGACIVKPWIDQQSFAVGFDQEAIVPPKGEVSSHGVSTNKDGSWGEAIRYKATMEKSALS
jgi:hypothetical protein